MTGPNAGTSVAVPRINLTTTDSTDEVALKPVLNCCRRGGRWKFWKVVRTPSLGTRLQALHFTRRQFPVRLAYCIPMPLIS